LSKASKCAAISSINISNLAANKLEGISEKSPSSKPEMAYISA
jgi:hypothetical protein